MLYNLTAGKNSFKKYLITKFFLECQKVIKAYI